MAQIQPHTAAFLAALKQHNDRAWFQDHREQYEAARQNVLEFVEEIIRLLAERDPQIPTTISAKKCLFRIYRDTRFSLDKTPYKTHFSAGISIDGKKLSGPEYYLHIAAEEVFIACGYWRPEKMHLTLIRQEIDYNSEAFMALLPPLATRGIQLSQEDKLKRPPLGYESSHAAIDYLKLKSFVLHKTLPIAEVMHAEGAKHLVGYFAEMLDFKQYIEQAIDSSD